MMVVQGAEKETAWVDVKLSEQLAAAEQKIEVITRGRDAAKTEKNQLETKVAELETRLENADAVSIPKSLGFVLVSHQHLPMCQCSVQFLARNLPS
jgi:hypothetical protein